MTTSTRHDLLRLARRQHWLVTYVQLRDLGHTHGAVRHLAREGHLHLIHRGVYAVGRPDLTQEARWLAAVLACGDGALLSHRAAGALWGLLGRGGLRPEVLVAADSGRRGRATFDVHRSTTLAPEDAATRFGIPVTTVARTLIDLAGVLDAKALKAAVRQGERLYRLDLPALCGRVARPRTNSAHARLFALLRDLVPARLSESELEARFLELCAKHRIPLPKHQYEIGDHRADFCWPDLRLVVETDGWGDHSTWSGIRNDHVKTRAFKAAGFDVERFTWSEVVSHPGAVARELRRTRARRARELRAMAG